VPVPPLPLRRAKGAKATVLDLFDQLGWIPSHPSLIDEFVEGSYRS
jgi:hypothetical protein